MGEGVKWSGGPFTHGRRALGSHSVRLGRPQHQS